MFLEKKWTIIPVTKIWRDKSCSGRITVAIVRSIQQMNPYSNLYARVGLPDCDIVNNIRHPQHQAHLHLCEGVVQGARQQQPRGGTLPP